MSGTHSALHLIELTSAHLCRDIAGLSGPLNQAVATPDGSASRDPSTRKKAGGAMGALTARLELCCTAWGPEDGPLPLARIQALTAGLPEKVVADVAALDPSTVFPPAAGRIVLNLLLLAADSLPAGGIIALAGAADDLFVRIAGAGAAWPAGLAVCLADENEARSALTEGRSFRMALTALLARAAAIRLSVMLPPAARNDPPILRLGG